MVPPNVKNIVKFYQICRPDPDALQCGAEPQQTTINQNTDDKLQRHDGF